LKKKIIKLSLLSSLLLSTNLNAMYAKKTGYKEITFSDGTIRKNGHRNWRNFNPGNIEYGKFAIKNGAIGTDGRFAIFQDMKSGYKAQVALLSGKKYRNKSIKGAITKYAPKKENNTYRYIKVITKKLGVSKYKKLSSLSKKQLLKMVKVMSSHEGMKKGIVKKG